MFVKRLILLFILFVSIVLAVQEAPNLVLILRDYHAVNCYVASYRGRDADKDYFARRIPVSVAQQDPEAACIASYMLKGQAIANAADNAASAAIQYPSNQFFWTQLAESLACEGQRYDPEILSRIAERLISLDPQNADYCVLKASAVLQLRTGNDVNEVLSLLRQAARCSRYGEPYELYRQRVMAIADKAGLGSFEYSFLQQPFPFTFAFRNVRDDLLDITQMKFNDGRTAEGIAISDALNDLWLTFGSRYVLPPLPKSLSSVGNYYMRRSPAMLELRNAAVSADRAHHDHLLLASAVLQYDVVPPRPPPEPEQPRQYVLAVPLLLHAARMVCAIVVILMIIIFLSKPFTSQSQVSVGAWNAMLFIGACLLYFLLSNLQNWSTFNICCGHHLTYLGVLAPDALDSRTILDEPLESLIALSILFSPLILLLVITFISRFTPRLIGRKLGIVIKIAISALLTAALSLSVWGILDNLVGSLSFEIEVANLVAILLIIIFPAMMVYMWSRSLSRRKVLSITLWTIFWSFLAIPFAQPYLWWLPFSGFLLTTIAIVLYIPTEGGFWRQSVQMFKNQQTAARALSILVPAVMIYLLLIPISVPWTMRAMKNDGFFGKPRPPTRTIFPPPTHQAYQAVLESFRGEKPFALGIGALAVLEPADLNSVLSNLTEKDWKTLSILGTGFPGMPGMPGIPPGIKFKHLRGESNQQPSAVQIGLSGLLDICPRSNVALITAALPDPNELSILIKRARLGDISAKQPLLQILWGKYDPNIIHFEPAYYSMPDSQILEALVPVSEPNEAAARLIAAIEKNFAPGAKNLPPAPNCHRILAAAMLLPSHQAASVLNAYLERCTSISPLAVGEYLSDLREVLPFCANASIANQFLESTLNAKWRDNDPDNEPKPPNITPNLGIQSIDLLKSALTSKYASFRAWSVWQLRRLGYKFTAEEIKLLKSDSNVAVRANLVMAVPEVMLRDFATDTSPIVQAVILVRTTRN